jgi:hypothetical protein
MGSLLSGVTAYTKSRLHFQNKNILFLPSSTLIIRRSRLLDEYLHSSLRLITDCFTVIPSLSLFTSHVTVPKPAYSYPPNNENGFVCFSLIPSALWPVPFRLANIPRLSSDQSAWVPKHSETTEHDETGQIFFIIFVGFLFGTIYGFLVCKCLGVTPAEFIGAFIRGVWGLITGVFRWMLCCLSREPPAQREPQDSAVELQAVTCPQQNGVLPPPPSGDAASRPPEDVSSRPPEDSLSLPPEESLSRRASSGLSTVREESPSSSTQTRVAPSTAMSVSSTAETVVATA